MTEKHPYQNQPEADRAALIESIMSSQHVDRAEAVRKITEGDWRGLNSTDAAFAYEVVAAPGASDGYQTTLSVPYDEEDDVSTDETVAAANVPVGVTPPHIVADKETIKAKEKEADERVKARNAADKEWRKSKAKGEDLTTSEALKRDEDAKQKMAEVDQKAAERASKSSEKSESDTPVTDASRAEPKTKESDKRGSIINNSK